MKSHYKKITLALALFAIGATSAFAEKTPPPPPISDFQGGSSSSCGCNEWKIQKTLEKLLKEGAISSNQDAASLAKIAGGTVEKKKELPPTIPVTQKPKNLQGLGVQKPQVDYMGELQAKLKKRQQSN